MENYKDSAIKRIGPWNSIVWIKEDSWQDYVTVRDSFDNGNVSV